VYTRTLAEIYARQGHAAEAAEIYRRLVKDHPDDPSLRERLYELERALAVAAGVDLRDARVDRLRALLRRIQARRRRL